jgi:hypothetical protein
MVQHRVVHEPLFRLGMTLGEGEHVESKRRHALTLRLCLGTEATCRSSAIADVRMSFVDIDESRVYTYEPACDIIGFQTFERKITSLALTADGNGVRQSSFRFWQSLTATATGDFRGPVRLHS